ncbi:MAG: class I SAM-dependent methyltransferase [Firmicutes bacterium]|nr:class I SAM-dependent methyltransferase [Bacillota bacterium]
MQYTYGTSNTAADRLYEISKFFNPLALDLIQKYNSNHLSLGVDIGCGPGFTTQMLARALNSNQIYGLDISDNFLALAQAQFPQYHFLKHDITKVPFPISAEVAYARFVLSHLANPGALINQWANQLQNNGLLIIDEMEDVQTQTPVFQKYLGLNKAMVANQGAELYVGEIIASGKYDFQVLCNESSKIPVPEWQAAAWFYPNTISIWKDDGFIKTLITEKEREEISAKILEIKESGENTGNTFWIMRRIVILKDF